MTREEFAKFTASMKCLYPKDKIIQTEDAAEIWFSLLKDIDYRVAMEGLGEWAKDNQWSPTIADVRKFGAPVALPWAEAYAKANAAASKWGRMNPGAAWEELGDTIWNAIPSWEQFCMTEMTTQKEQLFRSAYEASVAKATREYVRREAIDGVQMPTLPG